MRWTEDPLNLETPAELLCESVVTPTDLFYVRNHGPVPEVDPGSYRLEVHGMVRSPLRLSLDDLRRRFERVELTATITCAGNRRDELTAVRPIPDQVPWGAGATGNAVWGGFRLHDVLAAAGVDADAEHVAFAGLDQCEEEGERMEFGGSIPLDKALGPDVLLADEMNGATLPPAHGFPLRVVVPGYIGARSVKWLAAVNVQDEESANYFQARAYRLSGLALGELPVTCAVCRPADGEVLAQTSVVARGYALTGGSRRIERVEFSLDGGASFQPAELLEDQGPASWRLWQARLQLESGPRELAVRAWDSAATTQPTKPADVWNPEGYMNNAWHRVSFTVSGGE